ncbi:DUF1778 domain-containing protein [Synergistaceae bacterium OttesenSCG-928-I11]|nr:DUF1778 domain-containing protein [Synergistaceae bacterium OttesenSCG-928-I11]
MSLQTETNTKLDRVAARVPNDVKQKWVRAATMRGQTLTDFIIVATNNATAETFYEHEKIELSEQDQLKLAEMLLNPPELTDSMKTILEKRLSEMKAN